MADSDTKALKPKEKREMAAPVEQTMAGLTFTPAVDILETDSEITVLADMPGVKPDKLNIDLRENVLTMTGEVQSPEGPNEMDIFREYRTGNYFRQFTLSQLIDQPKIKGELTDGVLRLTLPKVAAATPRKITVKAG